MELVKAKGRYWLTDWLEDYLGRVSLVRLKDTSLAEKVHRSKVYKLKEDEYARQKKALAYFGIYV